MTHTKRQTYFTRLVISFLIVGIIPLAAFGVWFYTSSLQIVLRANEQRGRDAAGFAAEAVTAHLDSYRHIAYSVSKLPEVRTLFTGSGRKIDSVGLKNLYQALYAQIDGHLNAAEIHLIGADGKSAYSTHTIPHRYNLSDYSNYEGIFANRRPDPDRTYLYLDPFQNTKGERVACSFLREIPGGYVIVDVLAVPLVSAAEQPVFDTMLLADTRQLMAFDLFRPERDGTFDHFDELQLLWEEGKYHGYGSEVLQKGSLLIISRNIPETDLLLAGTVRGDEYILALKALRDFGLSLLSGMLAIILLLALYISRDIGGPVHAVAGAMEYLSEGIPPKVVETGRNDELGYLVSSFNRMVDRLNELLERTREEERALHEAEYKALQAQVQPHFLYNTLGTIKSIAKLEDVPEIVAITTGLGKMLRASISGDKAFISLDESLSILRHYIDIQTYRFGDRLSVHISVPDGLRSFPVPRLILQPLAENAIIHGLETRSEPLTLSIRAETVQEKVVIQIQDNGPGIPEEKLGRILEGSDRIGLTNVRSRMELLYSDKGGFTIESRQGEGTTVTLTFPETPDV
jgi:two-component system, sensor histidine kinase YesM